LVLLAEVESALAPVELSGKSVAMQLMGDWEVLNQVDELEKVSGKEVQVQQEETAIIEKVEEEEEEEEWEEPDAMEENDDALQDP
jgi:predicted lipoprotein